MFPRSSECRSARQLRRRRTMWNSDHCPWNAKRRMILSTDIWSPTALAPVIAHCARRLSSSMTTSWIRNPGQPRR